MAFALPACEAIKLSATSAALSSEHISGLPASRCIDGNTGTICHTDSIDYGTPNPWVRVFFNASALASVKVYNRRQCCQIRLGTYDVSYQDTAGSWHVCGQSSGPTNTNGPFTTSCVAAVAVGIEVKITTAGNQILHLGEVEAWGTALSPPSPPGPSPPPLPPSPRPPPPSPPAAPPRPPYVTELGGLRRYPAPFPSGSSTMAVPDCSPSASASRFGGGCLGLPGGVLSSTPPPAVKLPPDCSASTATGCVRLPTPRNSHLSG